MTYYTYQNWTFNLIWISPQDTNQVIEDFEYKKYTFVTEIEK